MSRALPLMLTSLIVACGGSQPPQDTPGAESEPASSAPRAEAPASTADAAAEPAVAEPVAPSGPTEISVTPPSKLKKGLKQADLEAASKLLQDGSSTTWVDATGKLNAKLGSPSYMITVGGTPARHAWLVSNAKGCMVLELDKKGDAAPTAAISEYGKDNDSGVGDFVYSPCTGKAQK